MIQLPRSVLESFFVPRAHPTSSQFNALISSVLNLNDDRPLLGLNNYNEAFIYIPGNAVVYNGIIYQAILQTVPGPFNISYWTQITSGTTGLTYKGIWDADLNVPDLITIPVNAGDFYVVTVAGNTNLDGNTDWHIGDWAISNGAVWFKLDNTDKVTDAGNVGSGAGVYKELVSTKLFFKSLKPEDGSIIIKTNPDDLGFSIAFDDLGVSPSRAWSSFKIDQELDGKEPLLGYPAENSNNRVIAFSVPPLDTKYPSEKLVSDQLDLKQPLIPYTTENVANRLNAFQASPDNNHYISERLAYDQLLLKEPRIAGNGIVTDFYSGAKTFLPIGPPVRQTDLTGLSLATGQVIAATDTVIQAFGYLQKQISDKVFGNNYQLVQNDSSTSNATTTYTAYPSDASPLLLTTPAVIGTFRIDWKFLVDNNKKLGDFRLVTISGGVTTVIATLSYEAGNSGEIMPVGGVNNIVQSAATSKEYRLQYRASTLAGGGTQNVTRGTMEIFRVI